MTLSVPRNQINVNVIEPNRGISRAGWIACVIGENILFDTEKLETYFFSSWQSIIYDALLVAAAVEFCDRTKRRPTSGLGREINLRIPVHEVERWNQSAVSTALKNTLNFLTGDTWLITFYPRKTPEAQIRQQPSFALPCNTKAVIPFSDGMDSRAVSEILEATDYKNNSLYRIRLGKKVIDLNSNKKNRRLPFTSVPYKVKSSGHPFVETSARSRGFKFLLLGGLAAYLAGASEVIVPESGQGSLGPVIASVGQAYEDYRNHPLFTDRLSKFIYALLDYKVQYRYPRLWFTKGETLKESLLYATNKDQWTTTWSCWQQSRQVSVNNEKRQCGTCAACMLRRLSVHAAGLSEPNDRYVWENLAAEQYEDGAAANFERKKITSSLYEYALAGSLHMDHLAALSRSPRHQTTIKRHASALAISQGIASGVAESKMVRLLTKHTEEWDAFVSSLGDNNFIANWIGTTE